MIIFFRIAAVLIGLSFLVPGLVGTFRSERLAEILTLVPETATGWVAFKTLIGAPYIAMAIVTLYAAIRKQWAWLAPIAIIEAAMALVRLQSGFTYGFETAGVPELMIETFVAIILGLASFLPARMQK